MSPVPKLLHCPVCGGQHIDRNEWATTRLHRTHLCEHCGNLWRPFEYHTIGVEKEPEVPMDQTHNKFKAFVVAGSSPTQLLLDVGKFSAEAGVAPKSVGIEYVESKDRLTLSLGYRDDEAPYAVAFEAVPLGVLELDPRVIEEAFTKACAQKSGVICHEYFVDGQGAFTLILMSKI